MISALIDNICIRVALQNDIPVRASKETSYSDMLNEAINTVDDSYADALAKNREKFKDVPDKDCFWPTSGFRSALCRRYGLKFKSRDSKTYFSKRDLLAQSLPSLQHVYALRKIFRVPVGQGRIRNWDESMHYRLNPNGMSCGS